MYERGERLSWFYSVFPWFDDPWDERGRRYFEETLAAMGRLLEHPWMGALSARGRAEVLELCGGAGFGGVALAKLLTEKGVDVKLTITDLRPDALERAGKWAAEELGRDIETLVLDARQAHKLEREFDIALLYGLSTPHFDPWGLTELLASVGEALKDEGLFVVEESDRRHRIFLMTGYKWALAEAAGEKLAVSFHTGYDRYRGTVRRHYIDFGSGSGPVEMETFMWGLAEVGAFMWCFFKEVDFLQLRGERHFILGNGPRRAISPGDLSRPRAVGEDG